MGNLKVMDVTLESNKSKTNSQECFQVATALSELALLKPTLKLDDETHALWTRQLLAVYPVQSILMAIEQVKHSDIEWVNFGTIATEARRLRAASGDNYAPHANPKRLSMSQLRSAIDHRSQNAIQYVKNRQQHALSHR